MINIFLASSSRFRPSNSYDKEAPNKLNTILESLSLEIEKKKYKVKITPWWNCPTLKKTDFVLTILGEVVEKYDMGFFIIGKDVIGQAYDTPPSKDDLFPNHNVIAELAMFHNAGKKTFIVSEDSQIRIPSDFGGLNTDNLSDIEGIKMGFMATLEDFIEGSNHENTSNYGRYCVYYNSSLSNKFVKFNSTSKNDAEFDLSEWESKALYVGTKSAFIWKNIEYRSTYPETIAIKNFTDKCNNGWDYQNGIEKLDDLDIDNVISFGPGIGKIDKFLMKALPKGTCYIPIDLNVSLAIESMAAIKKSNHQVPFAIVDDFEEDQCYDRLSPFIESNKPRIGSNNLFSMLGVTFSNLSMDCNTFFQNMQSLMKDEKDHLLLDVIIYDGISEDGDMSNSIKNNIIHQLNENKDYWDLIQNSIKKKGLDVCENIQDLDIGIFDKNSNEYKSRTMVPDTIVAYIKHPLGKIITIAKYYKYDSFKDYVKTSFILIASAKYEQQLRGVFLLKNRM